MEHNSIKIKELIRKKLLLTITPEERELLKTERLRYSEDEYDRFLIDTLLGMENELPEGKLTDWQPDIPALIRKAKAMKAAEENQEGEKNNE